MLMVDAVVDCEVAGAGVTGTQRIAVYKASAVFAVDSSPDNSLARHITQRQNTGFDAIGSHSHHAE